MNDRVISIILTFHNEERKLQAALEQLLKLTETGAAECIIVNDGSTDRSAEVLNYFMAMHPEFDRRSVTATNRFRQGTSMTFGEALKLATAEYVTVASVNHIPTVEALEVLADEASRGEHDVITPRLSHADANLNNLSIMSGDFTLYSKLLRRRIVETDFTTPIIMSDIWHHVNIFARAMARSRSAIQLPLKGANRTMGLSDKGVEEHLVLVMLLEKWFDAQGLTEQYSPFLDQMKFVAKLPLLSGPARNIVKWRATFPEINSRLLTIPGVAKRYLIRARFALA